MIDDSLTFRDLIVRVAEASGIGRVPTASGQTAGTPDDDYELDRVKRAINDTLDIMRLRYAFWRCISRRETVVLSSTAGVTSIDGDTSRAVLNASVQIIPIGQWSWKRTGSTGFGGKLGFVPMPTVDAMHQCEGSSTGHPKFASVIFKAPAAGEPVGTRRMELRVWPKPDGDYILMGPSRIKVASLSEDGDRSAFGSMHDQTVIAGGIALMLRNHPDRTKRMDAEAEFDKLLAASIEQDRELAADGIGTGSDGGLGTDDVVGGYTPLVTSVNGITLN